MELIREELRHLVSVRRAERIRVGTEEPTKQPDVSAHSDKARIHGRALATSAAIRATSDAATRRPAGDSR